MTEEDQKQLKAADEKLKNKTPKKISTNRHPIHCLQGFLKRNPKYP
jgi:hypothetical protein